MALKLTFVCLYVTFTIWTVTNLAMINARHEHVAPKHDKQFVTRTRRAAGILPVKTGRSLLSRHEEGFAVLKGVTGKKPMYPCGDGRCVCQGAHADCSGRNMSYVPQLPKEITSLDLSQSFDNNYRPKMTEMFFENVTKISWLDLSSNFVANINARAFRLLTNLACLNLSQNQLTCDDMSVAFGIQSLEVLVMKDEKNCDRLEDLVITNPMPRLQELDLSLSRFSHSFNLTCLSPFSGLRRLHLRSISAQRPSIVMSQALRVMSNLTYLDLSLSGFSCVDLTAIVTIPSLKVLILTNSDVKCESCPEVETGIEELNLGESFCTAVTVNMTCLSYFTGLQRLYLNTLQILGPLDPCLFSDFEALHYLPNLVYLDLSNNWLSCDELLTVLTIPSLKELNMEFGTDCTMLNVTRHTFNSTKMQKINLSHNSFEKVVSLEVFTELIYIDLSFNVIKTVWAFETELPKLQTFHLRSNRLDFQLDTCRNGLPLFPRLVELDLSENKIMYFETWPQQSICLDHLQIFNLHKNQFLRRIGHVPPNFLTFKMFQSLEILDMSAQENDEFRFLSNIYVEDTFRNPRLKSLNLADNYVPFTDEKYVQNRSFVGCPNLSNLSLANNNFKGMSEKRFQLLFSHLIHLTELSLRSAGLTYVTTTMFQTFTALKHLDLSDNDLFLLPNGLFPSLPQLISLNLSSNKITVVYESAFPLLTRQRLQHIDLSLNPFTCSCDILPFQKWLRNSPSVFAGSSSDYRCGNLPDTTVQSFFMQKQVCLLSPETSKFIIATISLILIGMTLLLSAYRYRWHLRLLLHEVFRTPEERRQRLREHIFQYDVFVSYDKEDFFWVRDHLMPSLEEMMELKLCLHQRDFIPGNPVVDNIVDSVLASKKILMLFSRSFAKSEWCQFELQFCLRHAMDTQDVLIVVMLENIPSRELTPAMMALMKTTTYIEWAGDADAVNSFWRRMILALNEVLHYE